MEKTRHDPVNGNGKEPPGYSHLIDGKEVREMSDEELARAIAHLTALESTQVAQYNAALTQFMNFKGIFAVLGFEQTRRRKSLVVASALPLRLS